MSGDTVGGGKFRVLKSSETIDSDSKGQRTFFRLVARDSIGRAVKIMSPHPVGWKPGQMLHIVIREVDRDAVDDAGE